MMTRVIFPSRMPEAIELRKKILDEVEAKGYGENATFAIQLALEEGLTNAVRHGNCCDEAKKVTVEYEVTDEQFEITICDEGCGFNPEKLPDPTDLENLDRPCGRGVMLVKAYMTEVSYNDRGNCVHMIKRKDCSLPAVS